MDILFKELHGNNEKTLVPINKFNGRYELTLGLKSLEKEVKVLKEKIPHLFDDIYFILHSHFQNFCYYKGNVWVEIFSLEWKVWEFLDLEKSISYFNEQMEEYEKENDYESIFSLMEKKILFSRYIELFSKIPDEQKYNIFREIWSRSEYGFDMLTFILKDEIFAYREHSQERNEAIEELKAMADGEPIITVYRGETIRSTPSDRALSWTLDVETAEFFARRFNSKGVVLKAQIHVNDIYDYLRHRKEEEVLLDPQKLINKEIAFRL